MRKEPLYHGGICFITDRTQCPYSCAQMVSLALEAGIKWVQLRDKDMSRRDLYEVALEVRTLTRQHDALFIVNDFADIAAAVDADGVHLGQEDLPLEEARRVLGKDKIIGVSTHDEAEALEAQKRGADYIGFGPIFHTETKDAGEPRGTVLLGKIRKKVTIPVVAIGGVKCSTLDEVFTSGAMAIAVASGILKGDARDNARMFMDKLHHIGSKLTT